jgi:hypothetical protein
MLRAVINAGNKRQGKSMTTMTAGGARTRWCAALLAVAGATCSELPPPERPAAAPVPALMQAGPGGPCVDDGHCVSRFCDRDFCAEPVKIGPMGHAAIQTPKRWVSWAIAGRTSALMADAAPVSPTPNARIPRDGARPPLPGDPLAVNPMLNACRPRAASTTAIAGTGRGAAASNPTEHRVLRRSRPPVCHYRRPLRRPRKDVVRRAGGECCGLQLTLEVRS